MLDFIRWLFVKVPESFPADEYPHQGEISEFDLTLQRSLSRGDKKIEWACQTAKKAWNLAMVCLLLTLVINAVNIAKLIGALLQAK